jgi:ATP-dependent HslUV protease ATP-binding subunit HslU
MAELQGRFPIRSYLRPLTESDFRKILRDIETNPLKQHIHLMSAEGIAVTVTDEAIDRIAHLCWYMNQSVEDIGARRLSYVCNIY